MHAPRLQLCCVATVGVALISCADSGAVVGPGTRSSAAERSIESAIPTSFDVPGSSRTLALDINETGQIVGRYVIAGRNHGFLRDANGAMTTIDYPGSSFSVASAVNDSGAIVGWYSLPTSPAIRHGFVLRDGTFTSFDPPGSTFTNPLGIDNRGDITGRFCTLAVCLAPGMGSFDGFLLRDGVFTIIDVPESNETNAFKPSENGAIVGGFGEVGSESLFVLKDGAFTTMVLPNAKPITQDDGGINARGDIVGTYCNGAPPCLVGPTDNHGFLLSGDEFTTVEVPGANATSLTAINARGDIVGGYTDARGHAHGLLLERHGGR